VGGGGREKERVGGRGKEWVGGRGKEKEGTNEGNGKFE